MHQLRPLACRPAGSLPRRQAEPALRLRLRLRIRHGQRHQHLSCSSVGGTRTVKGKVIDKDGGETEYAREVTVNNIAPRVSGTTPANAATGVSRGASLTANFSEVMKQTTLNQSTFKLFKVTSSGTTQVTNVTVSLSADGLRATLDPFGDVVYVAGQEHEVPSHHYHRG